MGVKSCQNAVDSSIAEVGKIDTRAPFESVKAAVSLFGEVALTSDRSTVRKPNPPITEGALLKETQLHLAKKELNKYKEKLNNAETTRIEALAELERSKRTVEELTNKLDLINESRQLALKATEAAKSQTKQLEDMSSDDSTGKNGAWKQELDSAREQYATSITEFDTAKKELRRITKDFETSMVVNISALQTEAEAKWTFDASTERAAQLSKEIRALQESFMHVKLDTEQAQQEESKIHTKKEAMGQSFKQALEETDKKVAFLKKEYDPVVHKNLEAKLAETTSEIGAMQKEIEDARSAKLEHVATVTMELDGAKEVLQKVAEEESALRCLLESLKLELEAVKREHLELKQKDAETETVVNNLRIKLQECKAELEAAMAAKAKVTSASDDLTSDLQQLSSESQNALQEAEEMKKSSEELRGEAEAARIALTEVEKKLQFALDDAEDAKAAEARALDQIKDLSEKAIVARTSISESGAKITISREEYESLNRKVEESEKLTEMKVAAGMAQVEAVRASENEAIKRLEAVMKETEEMESAKEEASKRAEMAEAAKKAVEGELRRWRDKEQKKAAETASRILAETQISADGLPERPVVQDMKPEEKTEENRKLIKSTVQKKALLPNISGIFHRKKNQVDGYLPGENPI